MNKIQLCFFGPYLLHIFLCSLCVGKEMNTVEDEIPLPPRALVISMLKILLLSKYMLNVSEIACKNEKKNKKRKGHTLRCRSSLNPSCYGLVKVHISSQIIVMAFMLACCPVFLPFVLFNFNLFNQICTFCFAKAICLKYHAEHFTGLLKILQ